MEDKQDLISHVAFSSETEDVESVPNLTADNKAFVIVKLEMSDDSGILTHGCSSINVANIRESEIKTKTIDHQNLDRDDDMLYVDTKHSMECSTHCLKHEYKFGEDSTPVMTHNAETKTPVFVKSEMVDESGVSDTTQFPHNITVRQDSKVKTEEIVHRNPDCDQHIEEGRTLCFKHECKHEEDSTAVMAPTVEAGTVYTTVIDKQYTCETCTM
jgi:hypothetical protein